MMAKPLRLPEGRAGQALAIALTLVTGAFLWFTVAAPAIGWYEARQAELVQHRRLAAHMAALGTELPALRHQVSSLARHAAGNRVLFAGDSDAIAGADLQSALQDLARRAGTSLDSVAMLPVHQDGALRRIAVQVSVAARWPILISLLEDIETAHPRMVIDGLRVSSASQPDQQHGGSVQASFTVAGFRAGADR